MGCTGFIPACAGNTPSCTFPLPSRTVHPRVCGEHFFTILGKKQRHGSSPRVRGTRTLPGFPQSLGRFIPACAGNTLKYTNPSPQAPVHPRVCGEHTSLRPPRPPLRGSSPRVRGTLILDGEFVIATRFIPACAGNTCPDRSEE